jgi:mono/diheme cytochrome c family protein
MKKVKKILLWLVIVIVVFFAGILLYIKIALPNVGRARDIKVEATPERIVRGEYFAKHVTVCIDCHSKRDWSRFSGPPADGTYGMGGDLFDRKYGFPGKYYAKNITPAGISRYSDGELFRAITTGVTKEGKALFPLMPYPYYGLMDEEDIMSVIAFIRTLKPITNNVPESVSDFPMNFLLNTIPKKAHFSKRPEKNDVINYGNYLVTSAGCIECHTKADKGKLIAGTEFGGGREFPLPDGSIVRSSNITPDQATGIGSWNKETFTYFFHSLADSLTLNTPLSPGDFNSIMPWTMFGNMNDEDLMAMSAYLKTLRPINNKVEKFTAAKK